MEIQLREYQSDFVLKIKQSIHAGNKRVIACAATGSGKAVCIASIAKSAMAKGNKVVVILPRRSLVLQLSDTFKYYGIKHGIIMSNVAEFRHEKCQIVSVDTYIARVANGRIDHIEGQLLCVDEFHTQCTEKKYELFRKYPVVVSFSATPIAPKNAPLNVFYDDIVESISMKELIKQGYLVPLRYYCPADFHSDKVKINRDGEYNDTALREYIDSKLKDNEGNAMLVGDVYKNWKRLASKRQTVIFCSTQAHAQQVTSEFISHGVKSEYVDCYTPDEDRKIIFDATANGTNQVIVNVGIISMGTDIPILSCVVLACPTNSISKYLQCIGRTTRLHETKKDALVIDHCGTVSKLGFADDTQYWSLDGKTTPEAKKKAADEEKKEPKTIVCKECQFVYKSRRDCPQCGFLNVAMGDKIPHHEQDLIEIKKAEKKREDTPAQKKDFYARLLFIAKQKGYKRGWADHNFKGKYGHWAKTKNGITPLPPNEEFTKYLKFIQIRSAKR